MAIHSQSRLEEIINNPGMYLPARTIYCLKAYVDGINSPNQTDVWDYLDGFYDWLLDTFNHDNRGAQDEIKLILHYMSNDPYDAFDRFFELLDEYKEGENLPLLQAIRERPFDFLPQRSIYALYAFFWGMDMQAQGYFDAIDLSEFEGWLQNQFENDSSWYKIIMLYSHDEFGALQQFATLYTEFSSKPGPASDTVAMV